MYPAIICVLASLFTLWGLKFYGLIYRKDATDEAKEVSGTITLVADFLAAIFWAWFYYLIH